MTASQFGAFRTVTSLALIFATWAGTAMAGDCPCRGQRASTFAADAGAFASVDPYSDPNVMSLPTSPVWADSVPQPFPGSLAQPVPATVPGTNRHGLQPPPGTLGQTYRQRSALIPDDKHPRFAAVEVHLPEDVDVTARGLRSKWTGKVWRLETSEPLLPGLPHIYAIKAEKRNDQGEIISTDVRWVRLIMGRVVDLKF